LKKIFIDYARIEIKLQAIKDFDYFNNDLLNIKSFIKFCNEYKVTKFNQSLQDNFHDGKNNIFLQIAKSDTRHLKLQRIFKMITTNSDGITFTQFLQCL